MKLLAIDTSSLACTVAVKDGDRVIERHEVKPREHTRLLMPMIRSALDAAGIAIADLDAIALGNGPGSFIGMRIGASVTQGLAFAAGLAVVPVSSLAAVAAQAGGPGDTVVVAQDAHMNQVYLGQYRLDDDGLPRELAPECLHTPGAPGVIATEPMIAAGAGFDRYPALLADCPDTLTVRRDVLYPHAADILTLAAAALRAGESVAPEALDPAYLRREVAARPGQR